MNPVYLASHNRPVHEVLFPSPRDIEYDYIQNFQGMTAAPVPLETLITTRERMIAELQQGLDVGSRMNVSFIIVGRCC
jgi:hypothetical protein